MTAKHTAKKKKQPAPATHKKGAPKKGPAAQKPGQWIIVTDHRQAHVYQKTPKGIERLPEECITCSRPLPGDEAEEGEFLRDLAGWLDAAEQERAFDRVALIAPPETLESIRSLVGKSVHDRICGALAREVEEITEDEIEDHIADIVWV